MFPGGQNLRMLREQLGLTMRDVETASTRIAQKRANDEFAIPPSRLSDVETKGVIPSIYRLYSLAVIYRRDIRELLSWYGVDLEWHGGGFGFRHSAEIARFGSLGQPIQHSDAHPA